MQSVLDPTKLQVFCALGFVPLTMRVTLWTLIKHFSMIQNNFLQSASSSQFSKYSAHLTYALCIFPGASTMSRETVCLDP